MESNIFSLNGKTICITGASSGIGRQVCVAASQMGATIIGLGRDNVRLEDTKALLSGGGHRIVSHDLTDLESLADLAAEIGNVDGLVHAAGIIAIKPFKYLTARAIGEINRINYDAPVLLTQHLLKAGEVSEGGSIIFLSSVASTVGAKGHALYAGSKGALTSLSRCLALELAEKRIRVNCVSPGLVHTPMFNRTRDLLSQAAIDEYEKMYPLGFGEPNDIAGAIVYLLSDSSRWVTGANLIIDGGFSCK